MFSGPESELGALGEVAGKDVVELGCGTAYFGAWLAKRGARVTGRGSVTPAQLDTARRMSEEFDLPIRARRGERGGRPAPGRELRLAVSEYGASIWATRSCWIAEAARLLRPGGRLAFLCNSTLSILCSPDEGKVEERLHTGSRRPRPDRVAGGGRGRQLPPPARRDDPHPARRTGSWSRRCTSAWRRSARPTTSTTTSSRPSGRGAGRPRRSGLPEKPSEQALTQPGRTGTGRATSTRSGTASSSAGRSRAGGSGRSPRPSCRSSATSRARTCSSSVAAPRNGRSSSRSKEPGLSGSTTPSGSSSMRESGSAEAGVDFPLSIRAPRTCRCPTRASTSSSATTARSRSPIHTSSCRRRRGSCGPGGLLAFSHVEPVRRSLRGGR